jgi:hypothetical protein
VPGAQVALGILGGIAGGWIMRMLGFHTVYRTEGSRNLPGSFRRRVAMPAYRVNQDMPLEHLRPRSRLVRLSRDLEVEMEILGKTGD